MRMFHEFKVYNSKCSNLNSFENDEKIKRKKNIEQFVKVCFGKLFHDFQLIIRGIGKNLYREKVINSGGKCLKKSYYTRQDIPHFKEFFLNFFGILYSTM